MIKPAQHISQLRHHRARRYNGPVDQDHRQAQNARGIQFGPRAGAPGIFGDDHINLVGFQQGLIPGDVKRATGNHRSGIWQRQRRLGTINKAQQVRVLWFGSERVKVLFANRQKHPRRSVCQGLNRACKVGGMVPAITLPGLPGCAFKSQQRHITGGTGQSRIMAHLCGKRVRCIHHVCNGIGLQECSQPPNAAKPADPCRQGLSHRICGTPSIRKHRIIAAFGQGLRQSRGLAGATKKKDAQHV